MTRATLGLTEQQAQEQRSKFGSNELLKQERDSFAARIVETIKEDPIIQILFLALAVQVLFFFIGYVHWYEPMGIFIAVTLATLVGTWSEYTSENQFQDLQDQASRILCKVYRDGRVKEIPIGDIVVGDVVVLQTGDKTPADGYLIEGELKVNQVALNGETESCPKHTIREEKDYLSDQHDQEGSILLNPYKMFRESVVEDGEALLQVCAVGKNTLSGSLTGGQSEEIDSPLKAKLTVLANGISRFGYIGGAVIAISYLGVKAAFDPHLAPGASSYFSWANISHLGPDIIQAVILSVLIIVMAVPEGLPMMIAMVLSLNMKKLLSDNILVRKMVGIETAGSMNILFSDKTGTLTEGKLRVLYFYSADETQYDSFGGIPDELRRLLGISLSVNTNASYLTKEDGTEHIVGGNVTEKALLRFCKGENKFAEIEVVDRIPFNSREKFMATQIKELGATLVKGAPEKILGGCDWYYDNEGKEQPLSAEHKQRIVKQMDMYAERAMRLVGVGISKRNIEQQPGESTKELDVTGDMVWVGLLAIRDELKPSSREAFNRMTEAGVQVVMITGDRKETARAIAQEMGMLSPDSIVLSSSDLQKMSDQDVMKIMRSLRVVARALPQDKMRLVKLSQELGLVTGMTGDGANDRPALEKADVGFSMGSGTEVAKEASDIVILDDSLEAISKTTLYGRTIYKSIQKFIKFQLTVSFAAVTIAFIGPFIGVDLPLSMTQILWVNLIMDTLAALALGAEPSLGRYMQEKPKKRTEAIITAEMWSSVLITGSFIVVSAVAFLKIPEVHALFDRDHKTFQTGFFLFFVLINVLNLLNVRNVRINVFENIRDNKYFVPVFITIITLQVAMTFFGGDIMRAYGVSATQFAFVAGWASLVLVVDTLRKAIFARATKLYLVRIIVGFSLGQRGVPSD